MGWEIPEELLSSGSDPENLTENAQWSLILFKVLPDKIDGMGAGWYGKDLSCLAYVMDLYEIENQKRVFELLIICISEYQKFVSAERRKEYDKMKQRR